MGKYIMISIIGIIIILFIFGGSIFANRKISSNIRYSMLVTGAIVFLAYSVYCFYNFVVIGSNNTIDKYTYLGVGVFLVLFSIIVFIKNMKRIQLSDEYESSVPVEYNSNVTIKKETKKTSIIENMGLIMTFSSLILTVALFCGLYL